MMRDTIQDIIIMKDKKLLFKKKKHSFCVHVLPIFEPTYANARWALRSRFLSVRLSVRLSVTRQKLLDNNSYLRNRLG